MKKYAFEGDQYKGKLSSHVMGSMVFSDEYDILDCPETRFRSFDREGEISTSISGLVRIVEGKQVIEFQRHLKTDVLDYQLVKQNEEHMSGEYIGAWRIHPGNLIAVPCKDFWFPNYSESQKVVLKLFERPI